MVKTLRGTSCMIALAFLFSPACKKFGPKETTIVFKQAEGEPIAKVGDITLTVEEMREDFLDRQGTFRGAPHLNTEEKRKKYVEDQVMQEAFFQAALEKGYFNNPKLRTSVKKLAVQQYVRDLLNEAQEKYVPTKEEMKEYYEKNPSYFNHEEAIKMAFLSVPFSKEKEKAKAREIAQKLQAEAAKTVKNSDTREFARLALKFAQDKNYGSYRIEANETALLEKAECETKFGAGSYDMVRGIESIGNIGPLLSTENAFYVFMKTGQRQKLNESVEDAEEKIKKRLGFEKRGHIYENLQAEFRKKYQIKVFEDKLAHLVPEPGAAGTANAAAAMPGNKPAANPNVPAQGNPASNNQ